MTDSKDTKPNPETDNPDGLNAQQRAAAEFEGRNLLVLAGAGTGKTRTIIARARHLLRSGVDPRRILILSFTKKSAKEIVDRLKCADTDAAGLHGQTFHSWCMELIASNPQVFRFGRFTVMDEDDTDTAFRLVCGRNFREHNFIKPEQLATVYSYAVNTRTNLSSALSHTLFSGHMDEKTKEAIRSKLPQYQQAIKAYLKFKADHGYLDYDDLLQKVASGLARDPKAADYIAGHYDHILVDEMQDTNPLQYLLLSSFWNRCNLFCVGDDAQSIYGFRGADFKSIHSFKDLVPQTTVMKLTLNYRSSQEILDFSNWLLAASPLHYDKKLKAARGAGAKPLLLHYESEWDQARDIAMRIKDSLGKDGLRYNDNMVLCRSNYGLRSVEACLLEAQIPYVIYGGSSLMKSRHIRDVMSALRIVANPDDELAWTRYLRLFPGIGEIRAAGYVRTVIGKESLDEALAALATDPKLPEGIVPTLRAVAEVQSQVDKALRRAVKGLQKILKATYKTEWKNRSADFPILERMASSSESIASFIADYVLDPALGEADKEGSTREDCAVLSTIHSAKGLEAANCYIVNASFSQYPSARALDLGPDAVEEDRRCLYVAMTRAKDRLTVYRSSDSINVHDPANQDSVTFSAAGMRVQATKRDDTPVAPWARADDPGFAQHYFLNNIPAGLVESDFIADERGARWNRYQGGGITLDDVTDFDFS